MTTAQNIAAPAVAIRSATAFGTPAWAVVLMVVAFATLLRIVFYTGYFGSDEVTYVESAFKLLHGDWSVDRYVGANRYGMNLPIAACGWLFGQNEFAAALYPMLCSIAEVALVTAFGIQMFGPRTGAIAGLLLATLPVHVHYAGRMMADAPLCLAVTASFLLFWYAEVHDSRWAYLGVGCAAGFSFWVKPAAVFYVLVLALYPFVFRRFNRRWLWTVAGFALLVVANNLLFWLLTGRFWFLFEVMKERQTSGYLQEGAASGAMANAPTYYLVFLFAKLYHTWLLGYLALATAAWWLAGTRMRQLHHGLALRFTLWWAAGLLTVLSLLVVSWSPLIFVPKQTNYMLLFVAPLCLLAGVALAQLRGAAFSWACALVFGPAMLLGLLQQASVQVFTSNSKAAVQYAQGRSAAQIYATTNAYRAAQFEALVQPHAKPASTNSLHPLLSIDIAAQGDSVAIIDAETLDWAGSEPLRRLEDVPSCWQQVGRLTPVGLGLGSKAAEAVVPLLAAMPALVRTPLQSRLSRLAGPAPAYIYRIPPRGRCGTETPGR